MGFAVRKWLRLFVVLVLGSVANCAPPQTVAPHQPPGPVGPLDADGQAWVEETLASLTLRQAVAQMVIPWIPGSYVSDTDPEFEELLRWVDLGLGGVSISIGVPDAYVAKLNRLQARALSSDA